MNKKFSENFKVNLWLSGVIKDYVQSLDMPIDWNEISPELKEMINKISHALKGAIDLSNSELESMESK